MVSDYKRLKKEKLWDGDRYISVRRWRAIRDIPQVGVKKGDITGYIEDIIECPNPLVASLWVSKDAVALGAIVFKGKIKITDFGYVRGPGLFERDRNGIPRSYLELSGDVTISGYARVGGNEFHTSLLTPSLMEGNIVISDEARVELPCSMVSYHGVITVKDNAIMAGTSGVFGNVTVDKDSKIGTGVILDGDIHVFKSTLGNLVSVQGERIVLDNASLPSHCVMENGIIIKSGDIANGTPLDLNFSIRKNVTVPDSSVSAPVPVLAIDVVHVDVWNQRFTEITQEIHSYESDIVKTIKYPVMTDLSNEATLEMVFALREVERSIANNYENFSELVTKLEKKFLIAESNARKIAGALYSNEEKKKTKQAEDLFSLACDDKASDNERRNALKQGFKRLEGILPISALAIESMRAKAGLRELEM